jgi:hypothetical protein
MARSRRAAEVKTVTADISYYATGKVRQMLVPDFDGVNWCGRHDRRCLDRLHCDNDSTKVVKRTTRQVLEC